ncbi:MAG: hypothetical protein H0W06_10680 [Chloroflexia bacterium]|nr:hypothetical protein [Chloroflexia bacterium]
MPYEDIDQVSLPDLKQDACLRAIIALKRAGKPIGPDPVAAFDAEPRLVMRAYTFAYRDALRLQLGRGRIAGRRLARWQRRLSLDHVLAELADPRQQEALDTIIDLVTADTRLAILQGMGLPGLSFKRSLRLIRLLRHHQRLKDEGTTVVPPHLRERLRLLRAATGLPISTRDL